MQTRTTAPITALIFAVSAGLMAYLRFVVFDDRFISLTYGLPLLICLFYPSRKLLWSMAGTFSVMAAIKAFFVVSVESETVRGVEWVMQVTNIYLIAYAVGAILRLTEGLRAKHAQLEQANQELVAREEEISSQNEELQAQSVELVTQNEEIQQQSEEIQQQSEEVQQQAEELQMQTEELQQANLELGKRQQILETLLASLQGDENEADLPGRICRPLVALFDGVAALAVVTEKKGGRIEVIANAGNGILPDQGWAAENSFSALVMEHNRTAYVGDLAARPDLVVPGAEAGRVFRSVLATPLRVEGRAVGTIEIYSERPHEWTKEQFRIVEWVSAQCSLILDTRRMQTLQTETNENLDRLVKARTAELQEMVNELEHFSYTITHDLRAPLRAINGFAEMLTEESEPVLNDQSRDYLRRITAAAGRMDRLITDALSYSRVVRQELVPAPMCPTRLLRDMIESYPMFQSPRAEITIEGELPAVMANEAGLTQCFSNLLGNAVKFIDPGRTPRVRIRGERRPDGRVRLWFEDNGIGIPQELQGRIFVMFQRLSKSYEGTGVGLALVRKVIERMGGKVGVESELGQGSRFWIELESAE